MERSCIVMELCLREVQKKRTYDRIISCLCPVITFYLFEFYTHNPFVTMEPRTHVLNIVFYLLMGMLFIGIFKYVRLAMMLQSGFFMVVGLVNYYVLHFRSAPIMPWDIFSIKTAASVADNYNYRPEWEAVAVLAAFVVLLAVESRLTMNAPKRWGRRFLLILLPFFLLRGYTDMVQDDGFIRDFGLYDKLFTPTVMNRRDGNVVAFLMEMEYMEVEAPEGYSASEVESWYQESATGDNAYAKALADPEALDRPNIIVIMNEAFSDPAVLGEIRTNEDYMPYIHSLMAGADYNTITGYLNVSVIGGNTANTEFEFLTGNTIAFLPQGSVAYQQYLKNFTPNMASYLKELGYETVAVHPYYPDGWERDRVYELMGFDEFVANNRFLRAEKIRNYISDEACYEKIKWLYENREEKTPFFTFCVTMQNHSGYEEKYGNFKPEITVEEKSTNALNTYLSLIRESDRAFQGLVEYFAQVPEDTMIVFFGDHQPNTYVTDPVLQNNGRDPGALSEEEMLSRYQVPYVIWANFDLEEKTGQETSANYLMIDVLENCGLPLPPYQAELKELRREYPVITAMQIRDAEGNHHIKEQCPEVLDRYRSLEYYLLFDYEEKGSEDDQEGEN